MKHWSMGVGVAAAVVACEPSPDTQGTTEEPVVVVDGMLTTTTWRTATDEDGLVEIPVEVGPGTTAFLVSPTMFDEYPRLLSLTAPDGTVVLDAATWLGSDQKLTGAFDVARKTSALAWPIRVEDGPLVEGLWHTTWASTDEQTGGTVPGDEATVVVLTKDDPDLSTGVLVVHLLWADGVDLQPGRERAVVDAIETWRRTWLQHGIELVPTFHTTSLSAGLPFVANGGADLRAASLAVADAGDLVVVLGDTMVDKPGVYGTSASTPGSPYPSDYHFVAVALDPFFGASTALGADEQLLLTETLAHEAAHFLGVPHPVEGDWSTWDALPDTPMCTSEAQCETILGQNLMFPYDTCGDTCPVRHLSAQQVAVLHRYVGVR